MMDCFACEKEDCLMKADRYAGAQPCFYCERAQEERISDICLICVSGQMCGFIPAENVEDVWS